MDIWVAIIVNISEQIIISDKIELLDESTRDISLLIIVGIIGVVIFIFRKVSTRFENFLQLHNPRSKDPEFQPRTTKYDNLSLGELEKINSRIIRNFTILISTFGVLFAFIVSENLSRAFVSWSFIIWTGWILAIIIRTGITAIDLSDIIEIGETKNNDFSLSRRIFAAKTFFRHSLYLLVPTLAFLPAIYFPLDIQNELDKILWDDEIVVGAVALGIIGVFSFVYFVAAKISDFETSKGIQGFWIFTILLISMGGISFISASPLSIEVFKIFNYLVEVPNVVFVSAMMIFFGGWISLIAFGFLLFHRIYAESKLKK